MNQVGCQNFPCLEYYQWLKAQLSISYPLEITAVFRIPKNDPKMAKFGFSANNFGTKWPRNILFGYLGSPGVPLPGPRTISEILIFGDCTICCGYLKRALNFKQKSCFIECLIMSSSTHSKNFNQIGPSGAEIDFADFAES